MQKNVTLLLYCTSQVEVSSYKMYNSMSFMLNKVHVLASDELPTIKESDETMKVINVWFQLQYIESNYTIFHPNILQGSQTEIQLPQQV